VFSSARTDSRPSEQGVGTKIALSDPFIGRSNRNGGASALPA
jgi:hypothetical protein